MSMSEREKQLREEIGLGRAIEDLQSASKVDDTEYGQWLSALSSLKLYRNASDDFKAAWKKEVLTEAQLLKEFRVVEEVVTYQMTVKRLEFIGDKQCNNDVK